MNKSALALSAALSLLTLGASAALAAPITGVAGNTSPGISDAFNVFYSNYSPGLQGIGVTGLMESNCGDPVVPLHGCSFSVDALTFTNGVNTVVVSPNTAVSNQVAVFYEPDGSGKISDIFLIGCDSGIRDASGKCTGVGNFTIITNQDGTTPWDFNSLNTLLSSVNISIGFEGTEVAGANATVFDLKNTGLYTLTGGSSELLNIKFVSSNELPEPFTMSVFGVGLAGAVALRRRKRKQA